MTLEAHYVLDEDSGSTAYDYSGNEKHGSVNNGGDSTVVSGDTGPFGNSAFTFDGTNDEVVVTETSNLAARSGEITYACWFKGTSSSGRFVGMSGSDSDGSQRPVHGLLFNNNNMSFLIQDSSNTSFPTASQSYADGNWHYITATYNDSEGSTLYVDGVEVATDSTTVGDSNPTSNFYIGTIADKFTDCSLADVRVYSRSISPQEVQALYQAGVQSEVTFR